MTTEDNFSLPPPSKRPLSPDRVYRKPPPSRGMGSSKEEILRKETIKGILVTVGAVCVALALAVGFVVR